MAGKQPFFLNRPILLTDTHQHYQAPKLVEANIQVLINSAFDSFGSSILYPTAANGEVSTTLLVPAFFASVKLSVLRP